MKQKGFFTVTSSMQNKLLVNIPPMKLNYLNVLTISILSTLPLLSSAQDWPKPASNYSWEGTWLPSFPIPNMYDEYYFDGHEQNGKVTPVLPPGIWDYKQDHNLLNWKNWRSTFGHFGALVDDQKHLFGWKIIPDFLPVNFGTVGGFFNGSPGADVLDFGIGSWIHGTDQIALGDGPDVVRFEKSIALFLRTGSSLSGSLADNDLVIAGKNTIPSDGSIDIEKTSIATGPGRDLIFIQNMHAAAVDAGCGQGGRTNATDPNDGDDIVVYGGNMHDFRFMGGKGNDIAVWYADEVRQQAAGWPWLSPAFFGGGGWGNALWEDNGTDRLIMAVSPNTVVANTYGAPPPGQLNVYLLKDYSPQPWVDLPTKDNLFARYCVTCGIGPSQKKTITIEYVSPNNTVFTGRFWLTAFEELQIGIGPGAKVYTLDEVNGKAILNNSLTPFSPPTRAQYNQVADAFVNSLTVIEEPDPGYGPTGTSTENALFVFPNPAKEYLNIRYTATKSGTAKVLLSDINGMIYQEFEQSLVPGQNVFQSTISKLKKGLYVVLVKEGTKTSSSKVIVK